ncbi:MAG: hypothetical protein J6S85_19075 [Methanobrevibacter sp.]|nr:hypothetical protein [Methanobrevibacter sp.]
MALNWYLTLRNLAKTDATAAELLEQLKTAESENDKETAKQNAQAYLQEVQTNSESSEDTIVSQTDNVVAEETGTDSGELCPETSDEGNPQDRSGNESESTQEESREEIKTDLSQPAFTPRLAKFGITREEELFLKGVFVRKMSREEKILMRRSIYQKKTLGNAKIQAEFKAKRIAQKQQDRNDPEKQKFHQERKYVAAIVNALEQHKNLGWIFTNIEGLTVDIFKELIAKPGNVNAFNQANPKFITNFKKKYGE